VTVLNQVEPPGAHTLTALYHGDPLASHSDFQNIIYLIYSRVSIMPRASIPSFDPNTTVGALEGGVLVSNLLFGIVTMQVYLYYQKYPLDRWSLKALVRNHLKILIIC